MSQRITFVDDNDDSTLEVEPNFDNGGAVRVWARSGEDDLTFVAVDLAPADVGAFVQALLRARERVQS